MSSAWRHRLIVSAPFLGIGLLAVFTPSDDSGTICPFALCTGSACPGCGLTRAASALVRGDLATAISYHPLVLVIGLEIAFAWTWFLLRQSGRVGPMSNRTLNIILAATATTLVMVWIARLATGTLPPV